MSVRFTVLASGSSGNASLLQTADFGVLIDAGLGPRMLGHRLTAACLSWHDVHALLLTHTHTDHWNDRTLAHLRRLGVRVYCHPSHHDYLGQNSPEFSQLRADGLVHAYEPNEELRLAPGICCRPVPLAHDGGATFGFRLDTLPNGNDTPWSLGYLTDLGCWTPDLAAFLADVDLLALEFNHDIEMERASGRSPYLIARVLGDEGHLSNDQAAGLLREVLRQSAPGRVRQLVQLHLSRQCNRPALAAETARTVLREQPQPIGLFTASQHRPSPTLTPETQVGLASRVTGSRRSQISAAQPWLPGLEE